MTDLLSAFLNPFLGIAQQFVDASFAVLSLFGFTAPNITEVFNSLLGIAA